MVLKSLIDNISKSSFLKPKILKIRNKDAEIDIKKNED